MSTCWHVLKSWASHLQTPLQQPKSICNSNIVCLSLKRSLQHWYFGRTKRFSSLTKRTCCFARKNRFLRLILVGRRKFKFLETKFVFEAKMMKKFSKKSLCFSHHRWYLFFFTPLLISFFHLTVDILFHPNDTFFFFANIVHRRKVAAFHLMD